MVGAVLCEGGGGRSWNNKYLNHVCTIERRSTKGMVASKACRGFPLFCVYNIGTNQITSLKMIDLKKIEVTTKF